MTEQQQHVELPRKLALRRAMLPRAVDGVAYVPFVGDGDVAAALYANRTCYAADIDAARVATARPRLRGEVIEADCSGWPFPNLTTPVAIADFDAYANPYPAIAAFWESAPKAERVVMFGTDGERMSIKRKKVVKALPECRETPSDGQDWRHQFNFWWPRYVRPWLQALIAPWVIASERFYLRGPSGMLYWAIVVEPLAGEPGFTEASTDDGGVVSALYEAACGGNVRAMRMWLRRGGSPEQIERVERVLQDAAETGNLDAIKAWELRNRRSVPQSNDESNTEREETLLPVPAEESDDDAFSARIANNLFREPSAEDQVREAFSAFQYIGNARKRAFLVAVSFLYEIVPSATACGISRDAHYRWLRDEDKDAAREYAEGFEKARQMVGQRAVSAVIQRGLFGWDEPVYYEGQLVGWTRKRNDRFAEKVAGWHMPELVKDRTETTHKGSIRAMAAPPWMAYLTDEELERLSVQSEELRKLAEARMNPEAKALPEKTE